MLGGERDGGCSAGSKESAAWLRQLAYEQSQLANESRRQCNDTAYQFSNQHVTNRIKVALPYSFLWSLPMASSRVGRWKWFLPRVDCSAK